MEKLIQQERFLSSWLSIAINLVLLSVLFFMYATNFDNNVEKYCLMTLVLIVWLSLMILLTMKLEFIISDTCIQYKLFPWQSNFITIEKKEIKAIKIRNVNALTEFGGIGIRYNKGYTIYLLKGNFGIDIQYSNKKILIGFSNFDKVKEYLEKYKYLTIE